MPAMGFGTSGIKSSEIFYEALKNGYRNFDTASLYDNEQFIGEALSKAI
jgi:diketogulonate reductase-like aldo/keto reductase